MLSQHEHLEQVVFGSFDGLTSALGVIAGLAAVNTAGPHIFIAAVCLAIAATAGMASGLWLSEDKPQVHHAAIMGGATFLGSVLPAIPFVFGLSLGTYIVCGVVTLTIGTLIGRYRGYTHTLLLLFAVSAVVVGFSLVAS